MNSRSATTINGNATGKRMHTKTIFLIRSRTVVGWRDIVIAVLSLSSIVVTRWDEKAGLRTGCGVRSQVIDVLKAQINKETGNEEG